VRLDRGFADLEALGDLEILEPERHESNDFALTSGETFRRFGEGACSHLGLQARRQPNVAVPDARMASTSVSIAKRLNTIALAPACSDARALLGCSLAVTTTTRTRRASRSMSLNAFRSIWRSSSTTSQAESARTRSRSARLATSPTMVTSDRRLSIVFRPWRKSA
jgi:hypothetical protein